MATMSRGANVSLTREIPGLKSVILGIDWDAGSETVLDENLVVATLLCDSASRVLSDRHFVFFNQLQSPDESVTATAQRLGPDEEQVEVALDDVPADVERIVIALYINEGSPQRRSLGQLRKCVLRVVNGADNAELVRSENLITSGSTDTAMTLGELYRHQDEWKFKVLGDAYSRGIQALAADFGLTL